MKGMKVFIVGLFMFSIISCFSGNALCSGGGRIHQEDYSAAATSSAHLLRRADAHALKLAKSKLMDNAKEGFWIAHYYGFKKEYFMTIKIKQLGFLNKEEIVEKKMTAMHILVTWDGYAYITFLEYEAPVLEKDMKWKHHEFDLLK